MRIRVDTSEKNLPPLRAGMSVEVRVDTGHRRGLPRFLAGLSGAYMLTRLDAWNRFQYASFWWLDLMVAVWLLFALMVYVLEPFVIHHLFHEFALHNKDHAFAVAIGLHAVALIVSAFAIGAGVLGAHGGLP